MILYTTWDIKEYEEGHILSTGFIVVLQELECLQYLSEVSISLHIVPVVKKFLTSLRMQKCIRHLEMNMSLGLKVVELPLSTLQRLKKLQLGNCYDLERVKINMGLSQGHISNSNFHNLVSVNISRCWFLDLTWLIYASSLEMLWVRESHEMEKIIGGDEHGDSEIEHQNLCIFSRLVALQLPDIPNLKSIHRWVLPFFFPRITVLGCPNLRKLPLNSNSATKTLKIIKEDSSWWEGLEWENDNLNCIFNRYFVSRAFRFESETQSNVIEKNVILYNYVCYGGL